MERLPNEVLIHELCPLLAIRELLSLFSVNRAFRSLSDDLTFWLNYLGPKGYLETQDVFIDWASDGRQVDKLCTLFGGLIDNLDYRTMMIVYMRLIEHRETESAELVRQLVLNKQYDRQERWEGIDYLRDCVITAGFIVRLLRQPTINYRVVNSFRDGLDSICRSSILCAYFDERIVLALDSNRLNEIQERRNKGTWSTLWIDDAHNRLRTINGNEVDELATDRPKTLNTSRSCNIPTNRRIMRRLDAVDSLDKLERLYQSPWTRWDPEQFVYFIIYKAGDKGIGRAYNLLRETAKRADGQGYTVWAEIVQSHIV